MKLKVLPEDFIVQEHINVSISKRGPYTLLKLEKRYWNTLDVIASLARRLKVSRQRFARAGLKDRYSLATQYLTYRGALKNTIEEKNYRVTPIGATSREITPRNLIMNAFDITLRDLSTKDIERIQTNACSIKKYSIPNYFDEQRFGSARHRHGFFAKALLQNHHRGALKLLLCYPTKEESKQEREFKRFCADHWGDWRQCHALAPRRYRKLLYFLSLHPNAVKEAIKIIDRELLNLYLLSYQSYLFNELLRMVIQENGVSIIPVRYNAGTFFFYESLHNRQKLMKLRLPIFTEKTKVTGEYATFMKTLLTDERITLKDFALRKMRFRGVRFKPFHRYVLLQPENFRIGQPANDELYQGKKKLSLSFHLPPGSYATLVVKRLIL